MKTAFGIAIVLGTAAVFTLNAPDAQAGRNKHHHGHSYHSDKVPTYLMDNLDETAQDSGAPGTMWAGTGIPSTNFVLRQFERYGIELAIKAHLRYGADILPTYVDEQGIVHIEVPAGPQGAGNLENYAKWNFAYSYDVELDPGNPDLEDYRGYLMVDIDPSSRTKYLKLKLKKLGSPNGDENGYGWVVWSTVQIGDDEGTPQVTQNSQNMTFFDSYIDVDPHTPGKQSYKDSGFGPGQFDVKMVLQHKYSRRSAELHVVFDVVDP
jgi:hypothetical protein